MNTPLLDQVVWRAGRFLTLSLVLALAGCGGPETDEGDAGVEGAQAVTELSALTLSPGATMLDGNEASLAGLRVVTLLTDNAFIVADGGEMLPDTTAGAPAEAPGGPVREDHNTRLLVVLAPEGYARESGSPGGNTAANASVLPAEGSLVGVHGWVEVDAVGELQEKFGVDMSGLGYEGDIVYVLADRVTPQ